MDEMKGDAHSILFVDTGTGRLELVAFVDESWGIVRRGQTICTWETDELSDCLRTFLDLANRRSGALRCDAVMSDRLSAFQPGRLN